MWNRGVFIYIRRVLFIFCITLSLFWIGGCGKNEIKVLQEGGVVSSGVNIVQQQYEVQQVESVASAGARNNPFLEKEEEASWDLEDKSIAENLNLTAIFYYPPNSKAIIDGRIVKEGDIIDNKEIIKINSQEVVLRDIHNEYILKLKEILSRGS